MLFRVGQGFDIHNISFVERTDKPLKLGGIIISEKMEVQAHSDGDALLHALIDSILGALGQEDIGDWFPPESTQWKEADSLSLLQMVLERTEYQKRWVFNNIDFTIVLQSPKLGAFKSDIKYKLKQVLLLPDDFPMAVKAKTFEQDVQQVWIYSIISLNLIK